MYRLLGPHINQTHGGIPELVATWQPPIALVLNPDPNWRWVQAETPRTRFVWRFYNHNEPDFNNPHLDPIQTARAHVAWILPQLQPWMRNYIQGTNETIISTPDAMRRYSDFEAERCRLLAHHGYRAALASFAVGNPTRIDWWHHFLPALATGRQHAASLLLHQYNWPHMLTPDAEWYSLRHRQVYNGAPTHNDWPGLPAEYRLPLIIGETGWDEGCRTPGKLGSWQGNATPTQYARDLDTYSHAIQPDTYILGAAIFCVGDTGHWFYYDTWPQPAKLIAENANPLYRQAPTPEPESQAQGLDASYWQGPNFDWAAARREGITFAFIRATHGLRTDPYYARNHTRAGSQSILRGPYHYLYPEPHPENQAAHFTTVARIDSELPPVLDVEEPGLTAWHVEQFVSEFYRRTHTRCAIYTSAYKWHKLVGANATWAADHPLWIADWDRNRQYPRLPHPWRTKTSDRWQFWQHTNRGTVAGRRVDLNRYNGTIDQLRHNHT